MRAKSQKGRRSMSDKNNISWDFLGDRKVFAEIFNHVIHGGQPVIRPENLSEADPKLVAYVSSMHLKQTEGRERDLLKNYAAMQDGQMVYLMLAIESRSEIDYGMPFRVMEYDVWEYKKQVRDIARNRGGRVEPFTAYLKKGELLTPVITLVVYLGTDRWDAPRSLQEMLNIGNDPRLKKFIGDYPLLLLEPAAMTDEEVADFKTEFWNVIQMLRYANNTALLQSLISNHESFQNLSQSATAFINALTGIQIPQKSKEGTSNMVPVFEKLKQECREEGRVEGREEEKASIIASMINYYQKLKMSEDGMTDILVNVFSLSPEDAAKRILQARIG